MEKFFSILSPLSGSRKVRQSHLTAVLYKTLLWDLAGQPGYRLIHQLHLNEVAVTLVVFDSHSETDPLGGIYYWIRALNMAEHIQDKAATSIKKILVAARVDTGGKAVSGERINSLVQELGFDGYFETSAKEGWQIPELKEAIRKAIAWEALPKVSSTTLFQRIKTFLIIEKEDGRLLSKYEDLYRAFLKTEKSLREIDDLTAQFSACIGRVESQGLIRRLPFGNLVLLQPELLVGQLAIEYPCRTAAPDPPRRRSRARSRRRRRLPFHTNGVGLRFQPATVCSNQSMTGFALCGC